MSDNSLSKDTIQRLAFIKYLLNIAVGQSRQPEPLAAASILTFHDSIELFLQLSCEHLDVSTKTNIGFMEYWEALKPKMLGNELTQKESMKRFNKSRVGLKHQGILPTKEAIEEYRASAINFFEDNTPLVFGVGIDSISMIDLIKYEAVKTRLKQAEVFKEESDLEKAMVEIAIAFDLLLNLYGYSTYFGEFMDFHDIASIGYFDNEFANKKLNEFAEEVTESIEAMSGAIKILSLGLDYRKYSKFQRLVPRVYQTADKKYKAHKMSNPPSIGDYNFCFNFIIESALHLQDFDFAVKG